MDFPCVHTNSIPAVPNIILYAHCGKADGPLCVAVTLQQQLTSNHHSGLAQLVPVSHCVQNGILSEVVLGELVLLQPHLIYQSSGNSGGALSTLFCKDSFIFLS